MPSRSDDVPIIEELFSDGDVMVGSLLDLLVRFLCSETENNGLQKMTNMNPYCGADIVGRYGTIKYVPLPRSVAQCVENSRTYLP